MAELPPRPSFKALFEDGKISLRSAKFRRNAGALSWRQKYLNADIYPIEMNDSRVIRLQQVKNGKIFGSQYIGLL